MYREVKRNARVGELIRVTNATDARYQIGDVFEVDEAYMGGNVMVRHSEGRNKRLGYPRACILESEYVVLEPVAADTDVSARLSALEQRVAVLESRLSQPTVDECDSDSQRVSDASYTRDQVVELAKRDIDELKHADGYYRVPDSRGVLPWVCNARFVVNRTKRTVACLMHGYFTSEIFARGIAHCASSDCFNVHIGKAIALRRALGLDVPAYYTDAPQPTKVQVGDVVEWDTGNLYCINKIYVDELDMYDLSDAQSGKLFEHYRYAQLGFHPKHSHMLTDDSHDYSGLQNE